MEKLFPTLFQQCIEKILFCDAYEFVKHSRTSYYSSNNKNIEPFMIIHLNVWGPSRVVSSSGFRWFVMFIDCYSCATWIYLLHSKDEVFSDFKLFYRMICMKE